MGEDETDEGFEDGNVEVSHDEKAERDGDDAEELDVVVGADAVGEVVADFLVEDDAGAAGGEDEKTE